MNPTNVNSNSSKDQQPSDRFANTEREESHLGNRKSLVDDPQGFADGDQPVQRPPESQPEPRPMQPTMTSPKANLS